MMALPRRARRLPGLDSELRRATDNPVFFTGEVKGEQRAWVDGLAERITWPGTDAPAVCVLDNHLALFAQATIQPFKLDGNRKFNELRFE
jgi:hypothetical protein